MECPEKHAYVLTMLVFQCLRFGSRVGLGMGMWEVRGFSPSRDDKKVTIKLALCLVPSAPRTWGLMSWSSFSLHPSTALVVYDISLILCNLTQLIICSFSLPSESQYPNLLCSLSATPHEFTSLIMIFISPLYLPFFHFFFSFSFFCLLLWGRGIGWGRDGSCLTRRQGSIPNEDSCLIYKSIGFWKIQHLYDFNKITRQWMCILCKCEGWRVGRMGD